MVFHLVGFLAWAAMSVMPASIVGGGYSDWAVIVVSGDDHATDGNHTNGFDNARRDVSRELEDIGFDGDNIKQFTVDPRDPRNRGLELADKNDIATGLWNLSQDASSGCLIYFSSHGSPDGIVVGDDVMSPHEMALMVDNTCGSKPTVVILSACYSGAFIPALKGPNRFILTAARADRTSFGCGQDDKYPFFDTCVLKEFPRVHGFAELADRVKVCVAAREHDEALSPPSDPQEYEGTQIAANLSDW